jgi:hypothetical protein
MEEGNLRGRQKVALRFLSVHGVRPEVTVKMRKLSFVLAVVLSLFVVVGIGGAGAAPAPKVGANGGGSDYPSCSPYTVEGPSEICSLGVRLNFRRCEFSDSTGSCLGDGYGTSPWGLRPDGGPATSIVNWAASGRERGVVIISQLGLGTENPPLVRMECHMADPGSHRLTVDRARVKGEDGVAEFFTPDLPGQAAGEPGGPLDLNYVRSGPDIFLNGYLYVKRPAKR